MYTEQKSTYLSFSDPARLPKTYVDAEFHEDSIFDDFGMLFWAIAGHNWAVLRIAGYCWALLAIAGHCWLLLGIAGCYWAMLGIAWHWWLSLGIVGVNMLQTVGKI